MKLKHTKEQWVVTNDITPQRQNMIYAKGTSILIAFVQNEDVESDEEREANAKLIAAAPQMLVDLITNYLMLLLMPSGFRNTPDGQILLSMALSSICNATGEPPQETQDFFEHISVSIKLGELDIPKAIKQITE